jgi:hypothetical protein
MLTAKAWVVGLVLTGLVCDAATPKAFAAGTPPPRPNPATWILPTTRAKVLYAAAIKAKRNPAMFTVAGDSNAMPANTIGLIPAGKFDFGNHGYLRNSVAVRFAPSFARLSVAVGGGFRAADMFDANFDRKPASCAAPEGVFACELRQSNASIVFVSLGTGDKFVWREYENNLRAMIDYALNSSVLPILMTKADDLEQYHGGAPIGHINDTVRRLAAAYQLPLIDFYAATRALPRVPNPKLPHRPFEQFGLHDEWGYYFHLTPEGRRLKVLCMLQMLELIGGK